MADDNLDLEAQDRLLLEALANADREVRDRARRLLDVERKRERDEKIREETRRANRNAGWAHQMQQRAQEAERELEEAKIAAERANDQANDHAERIYELEGMLNHVHGTLSTLAGEVGGMMRE